MNTNQPLNEHFKMNMKVQVASKPKFIDTAYLMEISSGSTEFIAVFLKMFKEEAQKSLESILYHLRTNDFTIMERAAHTMKPTGAYVGSHALTLLVGLLEKAAHRHDGTEVNRLVPQVQLMTENIFNEIDEYLKKI